jgi:hypothetical protein
MCCTVGPASLSDTIIYAAEVNHDGKLVHVLGYQNRAENKWNDDPDKVAATNFTLSWEERLEARERLAGKASHTQPGGIQDYEPSPGHPNAMILPFPAETAMGPANIIDTRDCKKILDDYNESTRPKRRSVTNEFGAGVADFSDSVQVFQSGNYHVVLAANATALSIQAALQTVPAEKRPSISKEMIEGYLRLYGGWTIAICCFSGTVEAEPLLWWYEPRDATKLFLPTLDAHDGGAPNVDVKVLADHVLIVGSSETLPGVRVEFTDTIPETIKPFLTPKAYQRAYYGELPNGDFYLPVDQLRKGSVEFQRIAPKSV